MQKNITKNDAKMKHPEAIRPKGPGPGVPEEVRSSSGDSRSRFPLACNIIKKANIRQTTEKQSPRTEARTRTHLTCRQALRGYWAHGPTESSCARGSPKTCWGPFSHNTKIDLQFPFIYLLYCPFLKGFIDIFFAYL